MNKKTKNGLLCALCASFFSLCAFAACNSETATDPAFLEGSLDEIVLGEEILIEDYVDFGAETDYKLTVTDPNGITRDITSRVMYAPEELGTYVLTYTINSGNNSGTATFKFTVIPYDMEWSFNNGQSFIYQLGSTVTFQELFNSMNVTVQSYCDYEVKMQSVLVDGERLDLTDKTSYTFESLSDHVFRFRVDTEDGQSEVATVIVRVQYKDPTVAAWMEENNITDHEYINISADRSVLLNLGSFTGKAASVSMTDLPYIAYNGEYGVNDYVMFDFTGDNLPQLCFFADEATPDLIDGKEGIFINNGFIQTMASENMRLTVYGPNKISHGALGGSNRISVQTNAAIGSQYLDANTKYRYIAGFSDAVETEYDDEGNVTREGTVVLNLLLLNLDYGTVVYEKSILLNPMNAGAQATVFPVGYFSGKIVAYGQFNTQRMWDKIYPVYEDIADIRELVHTAELVENCDITVKTGVTLNVTDYVADKTENGEIYYTDEEGNRTDITGDGFAFATAGKYRLYYDPLDGTTIKTSVEIVVTDIEDEAWSWLREQNIGLYKTTVSATRAATTEAGDFTGKAANVSATDVPYIVYKGDYGVDDYVMFDFTGSNLPQLTFFAEWGTPNLVDGNAGVYVNNGFHATMASEAMRLTVYGPWKLKDSVLGGGAYRLYTEKDSAIGALHLSDTMHYRYIAGISEITDDKIVTLHILLMNLDEGVYVYDNKIKLDLGGYGLDETYFTGNIVAHGNFERSLVWDKIYPITEDAGSAYELVKLAQFNEDAEYTVPVGETLQVEKYVTPAHTGYALYYTDESGTRTDITGDTFRFDKAGKYKLYYFPNDGVSMTSFLPITASAMAQTEWAWLIANNAKLYNATLSSSGGATFEAGSFIGADEKSLVQTDFPYLAYSKETGYGAGDIIAFDFTGDNMPNVSFFGEKIGINTKNVVNTKGFMFTTGLKRANGYLASDIGSRLNIFFPTNMANSMYDNALHTQKDWGTTLRDSANAATKYRCIIGFTSVPTKSAFDAANNDETFSVTYAVRLIDLNTNETVYDATARRSFTKANYGSAYPFNGNIVLYGRSYETTVLDKVYPIFEDTTIDAVTQTLKN